MNPDKVSVGVKDAYTMPTKKYNKTQRLMMIRDVLNFAVAVDGALKLERTGDKERDAQRALELVERETGQSFGESRPVHIPVPGTRDKFSEPIIRDVTPQAELIEDLSTCFSNAPCVQTGHRVSLPLHLGSRVLVTNGQEQTTAPTLYHDSTTEWEKVTYSTPMKRATLDPVRYNTEGVVVMPWATDKDKLSRFVESYEVYRSECVHSHADYIALNWTPGRHTTGLTFDFTGNTKSPEERLADYRLISKYRAINEVAYQERLAQRMADKHAMKLEQATAPRVHPAVPRPNDHDALGFARPVFRPRPRWFTVSPVPVNARAIGVSA